MKTNEVVASVMVERVRCLLEESRDPSELVGIGDVRQLTIEDLILANLPEAISTVTLMAPSDMLTDVAEVVLSVDKTGDEHLDDRKRIERPADAIRVVWLKADTWDVPSYDVLQGTSPEYRICQNKRVYSLGVKGRPTAFYVWSDGKRVIELYPSACKYVEMGYVEKPELKDGKIQCDVRLYEAACYYCAYLVSMIQGWRSAEGYRREAAASLGVELQAAVQDGQGQ